LGGVVDVAVGRVGGAEVLAGQPDGVGLAVAVQHLVAVGDRPGAPGPRRTSGWSTASTGPALPARRGHRLHIELVPARTGRTEWPRPRFLPGIRVQRCPPGDRGHPDARLSPPDSGDPHLPWPKVRPGVRSASEVSGVRRPRPGTSLTCCYSEGKYLRDSA